MKPGFTIKRVKVTNEPFTYYTHRLSGWLGGRRIRENYKCREEADGRKNELEVKAGNVGSEVRARHTRLSAA